jgi:hypothetical protein
MRQKKVKFEELTITNIAYVGLYLMGSETNVDVLKCAVKECGSAGMFVEDGTTFTATQCEFMENAVDGVFCDGANTKSKIDRLHDANDVNITWWFAIKDR